MKSNSLAAVVLIFNVTAALYCRADSVVLELQSTNGASILELRSNLKHPISGSYSQFEIQWSADLTSWERFGDFIDGKVGVTEEKIRQVIPRTNQNSFFRVTARAAVLASNDKAAESIYGYASEFNRHLNALGQLPLADFVQMFQPTNEYRAAISFDVTTANYWSAFNLDPAVHNSTNTSDPRLTDFRLNEQEFALFKTNGYVVSQRLGSPSFADSFYKIFTDDLPVYITTDALLQAWHHSYLLILTETEEAFLAPRLHNLLTSMLGQVEALNNEAQGTPFTDNVRDADYFLAIGVSLITGQANYGQLGQTNLIDETLAAVNSLQPVTLPIFGTQKKIDFSQFKPRGQYEKTVQLQRYFRAMMWCALADMQFIAPADANALRQFSTAAALDLLLDRAGQREAWMEYDSIIRGWVGAADCLNFAQLHDLLTAGNFAAPFNQLPDIYEKLWTGDLGVQNIRSGYFYSPLSPEQLRLPRSFSMMPQRFTMDSWALAKVVFDEIYWDTDGVPGFSDKVMRRVPSGLDVAFGVFGNDNIVPEIAARIANPTGHPWRDGYPYQHNLAAVRKTIDAHEPASWTNNLYSSWINTLRALSKPTATPDFPEAMQTRAFADSTLNSQLASWTHLRHDTILYAKQSYTSGVLCGYPDAWVEPRVEFWDALHKMAARGRDLVAGFPAGANTWLYTNRVQFFERFMDATSKLKSISEKELLHLDLSEEEITFLEDTVEIMRGYNAGMKTYSGWYPKLFYRPPFGDAPELHQSSGAWDALVTDVHTDVPAPAVGDPGSVLHQAVGNVHTAFIAINCNDGHPPRMFAGPVLSHYEFETGPTTRLTDSEWKERLKIQDLPPAPPWTRSFLVPGSYTPRGY